MRLIVISLLAIFLAVLLTLCSPEKDTNSSPQKDTNKGIAAYEDGDYEKAVKLFHQAAEQGHVSAQYNLGLMYAKGEGVAQNHKKAIKWWRQAAEQGDAEAQFTLAMMYYTGMGVTKNEQTAYMFFLVAMANAKDESEREIIRISATSLRRRLTLAQKQRAHDDAADYQVKIDARQ